MSPFSTHNGKVSLHRNVGTWRHVNTVTLNFMSLDTPKDLYDLSHNRERYLTGSVVLRASRVVSMLLMSVAARYLSFVTSTLQPEITKSHWAYKSGVLLCISLTTRQWLYLDCLLQLIPC